MLLAEAVKLDSHFENALEVLSARLNSNLGQVNLKKGSVRGARHLLGPWSHRQRTTRRVRSLLLPYFTF